MSVALMAICHPIHVRGFYKVCRRLDGPLWHDRCPYAQCEASANLILRPDLARHPAMARVKDNKIGAGRDPDIIRSRPTLKAAFIRPYAAYANRERASGRSPLPPVP
jgi:hypothetical protein